MSPYLLILLILAVALSPLLSALPNRRQRKLAQLRQAAASSGLFVKLQDDGAVFYGCRRQRGDERSLPAALERAGGGWDQERGDWPAERQALLADLPEAVMQVREDLEAVGVFWDEEGSAEDVHAIASVLRKLLGRHW